MSIKPHFVVFSDHHFEYWSKYNADGKRTWSQVSILEQLFSRAHSLGVPLLFGGDLFHNPEHLSNSLMSLVFPQLVDLFNRYPVDLYAISGNHDMEGTNTLNHRSPSYIHTLSHIFPRFHCIDFKSVELDGIAIHGIPYITHNQDYAEIVSNVRIVPGVINILINHTDYKGQTDTNGIVIGKGENITENLFERFDMVLSGHVHKMAKVFKNVRSIGSTHQTRLSDMDGEFGYHVLKTVKGRLNLVHRVIDNSPKYRYYTEESEIDNTTDFWVKLQKGEEDIAALIEIEDGISDYSNVVKAYSDSANLSRSKRVLLFDLIKAVTDED